MSLPSLLLLLASFAPGQAKVVKLSVDVQPNTTVSGLQNFRVLVTTDDIVTKVEMYVGTERRAEDESTPYRFSLDTVNEADGPLDLKWIAYTDQGRTGTLKLHVTVDNGASAGTQAIVADGMKALQDGNADLAITKGRVALKLDKKYVPARFLLAQAYAQKGVYDKAQQYVQDVLDDDPKNLDAMNVASAINLRQAFSVMNQGGDTMDTLDTVSTAFKSAAQNRRKFVDAEFDAAPKDAASLATYVSEAISASRFSDAINVLAPAFKAAPSRADLADRLAYCQMRDGRYKDALTTLDVLKRIGANTSDAYAQALEALVLDATGQEAKSDKVMSDAELNDAFNVGVETAQASIALRRGRTAVSKSIADGLVADQGQRTEVNYLLAALSNQQRDFQTARHYFELALLADPINYDMYVEEGNTAIEIVAAKAKKEDIDFQYAYAAMMYQTALLSRSDSYQALTGLALASGLQGKMADAYKYAQAAADAQPASAAAQYALSACASAYARVVRPSALPGEDATAQAAYAAGIKRANELDQLSVKADNAAGAIDPDYAGGRGVPSIQVAFDYFAKHGRSPVISRPG